MSKKLNKCKQFIPTDLSVMIQINVDTAVYWQATASYKKKNNWLYLINKKVSFTGERQRLS